MQYLSWLLIGAGILTVAATPDRFALRLRCIRLGQSPNAGEYPERAMALLCSPLASVVVCQARTSERGVFTAWLEK